MISSDAMAVTKPAPMSTLALLAASMLLAVLVLLVVALLRRRHHRVSKVDAGGRRGPLPPGPVGLPVIGNMHQMVMNKPVFRWVHRLLAEQAAAGGEGEIVCVRLGPVHVIAIASPEMAREVLRKNDAVFADRPRTFAAEAFSVGYRSASVSPHGDQWRKMRRVLTAEILSPSTERRLRAARDDEADHLVHHVYLLAQGCGRDAVDVRHVARHFCGNVIRRLTFGRRHFRQPAPADGAPGRDDAEHVDALFATLNYLDAFSVSDYFPALVGLDLDGHEKVVRGVMATLSRLHDPIVEERVEEWRLLRKAGETRNVADFLDVLASLDDDGGGDAAGRRRRPLLTVEEIKAQTIDIMIATVDNPSNAVEWALAEMVNKPEVMRKAMDELDAVVGRDRLVQERDVRGLNYLKACIREAFRLHPYHPFNPPRVAMADATVSGYTVPRGSHVVLSRVGLGRNPRVWGPDALVFRPERHLDVDDPSSGTSVTVALTEPELRFVSFSTGRRGCPGVSLGTLITVTLFARLLQGFEWSGGVELREAEASLVLARPLLLRAKPRLPAHLYVYSGAN